YGQPLTTTGNTMVGETIAQALRDSTGNSNASSTGGHLPVFLDLRTAAEIGASTDVLDFGDVIAGSSAMRSLSLFNSVDATIYGVDGIQSLSYTLSTTNGFSAPGGTFADLAGGTINTHSIGVDTSMQGLRAGTLTVVDASGATRTITLRANVVPEPATLAALGLGMAALLRRRKRA
ncbi:PEP-CTERM sorting domain-containing protein, partial [bacterium]